MRQRSLKRRCGGNGTGPRAGREAWEFEVLLLEEDLESKGPAALMCSSGSGSLLPLFLICRDVKSGSTERHYSAVQGWAFVAIRFRGGGVTTWQLSAFSFISAVSDTFNLENNLAAGWGVGGGGWYYLFSADSVQHLVPWCTLLYNMGACQTEND